MLIADLLIALAIGLLLTAIFSAALGNRGPWGLWWVFLLVVFLTAWAGGAWITPFGPPLFGAYWLPALLVGLAIALLVAAAAPLPARRVTARGTNAPAAEGAGVALGIFFWIFVVAMLVAIIVAYV